MRWIWKLRFFFFFFFHSLQSHAMCSSSLGNSDQSGSQEKLLVDSQGLSGCSPRLRMLRKAVRIWKMVLSAQIITVACHTQAFWGYLVSVLWLMTIFLPAWAIAFEKTTNRERSFPGQLTGAWFRSLGGRKISQESGEWMMLRDE